MKPFFRKKALHPLKRQVNPLTPARIIFFSFAFVILTGTLLLMLPFASKSGQSLSFIEALFTSTSCVCVTGLTLVDPYTQFTLFGQTVMLLLIEIGGVSLLTFSYFFLFVFSKKRSYRSIRLAQESANAGSWREVVPMIKSIILLTISIQCTGAVLLSFAFVPQYGLRGIWISVFTAISAFCNAGFDVFGFEKPFSSLATINQNYYALLVIALLIILGGIGFMVIKDVAHYRKNKKLLFHTKMMLWGTGALLLIGTLCFFIFEYNNSKTIGSMNLGGKLVNSFFQSTTARTAGFASYSMGDMRDVSKFLTCVLMFIGAGSSSTGGGIKLTTFLVLVMTVYSAVRGREDTTVRRHRIIKSTVYKSLAILFLSGFVVLAATAIINLTNPSVNLIDSLFEAVSAFGTVGLTADVTLKINLLSHLITIATMFIGRIGPLAFVLAVTLKNNDDSGHKILPEGRLLVG